MGATRRPTRGQLRRRRAVAAAAIGLVLVAVAHLAFSDAIFGPSNAELAHQTATSSSTWRSIVAQLEGISV